ncbi:hypothetical protein KO361_06240 [Candidatus Woesearchaeota archaeon]|nr:hypothetical protein [Candidatus Woesearchaeota archaeon]
MKSKEIKEFVEQGYLHINVLFEVVGNPKEHVEAMVRKVMEGVKSNKGVNVFKEDYGDAEDAGDGLWGTFCEAEMLIKDVNLLSWIGFNFSPASIEVKAPKEVVMKDKDLSDFMGELLAQLHQNNMNTVQAKSESKGLLVNFNALMRNAVLLALRGEEMTSSDIGKAVGISEEGIIPVLEAMIKEKTLDKKGDKFFRI